MILVTGATGQLGAAVIEQLVKHTEGSNIVAFARSKEKAADLIAKGVTVRIGSFDDTASLDAAMQGVSKVLLISGVDQHRLQQHKNVVDAAQKAGVQHIAYTGVSMVDEANSALGEFMLDHFNTEAYIKESGIAYTLLRNTLYTDGIPLFTGEQVLENRIFLPAGDGKVPYALRAEMGEAAANVLLQEGHANKTYEIASGTLASFADIAQVLTELSGKQVNYTDVPADAFAKQLEELQLPEFLIFLTTGFSKDIKDHRFENTSSDLEQLLGRKPTDLKTGLKQIFNL